MNLVHVLQVTAMEFCFVSPALALGGLGWLGLLLVMTGRPLGMSTCALIWPALLTPPATAYDGYPKMGKPPTWPLACRIRVRGGWGGGM